jgi:hypothetical protein
MERFKKFNPGADVEVKVAGGGGRRGENTAIVRAMGYLPFLNRKKKDFFYKNALWYLSEWSLYPTSPMFFKPPLVF